MSIINEYLKGWDELAARSESKFTPPLSHQILQRIGESFEDVRLADELGEQKMCYSNSFAECSRRDRIYCEGLCVPSGRMPIPIFHAWTCDLAGRAIEHTLKEPAVEYLGIPMRMEFVAKFICTTGYYGIFDNIFLAAKDEDLIARLQDGSFRKSL